jgi:hypothetical protein
VSVIAAVDSHLEQVERLLGTSAPPTPAPPAPPGPAPAWPQWDGDAAQGARQVSTRLGDRRQQLHEAQAATMARVTNAATITTDARTQVAAIRSEWERAKAAVGPFAETPEGQAVLLQAGQAQVTRANGVIHDAASRFNGAAQDVRTNGIQSVKWDIPLKPPHVGGDGGDGGDDPKPKPKEPDLKPKGKVFWETDHGSHGSVWGREGTLGPDGKWSGGVLGYDGDATLKLHDDGVEGKLSGDAYLAKGEISDTWKLGPGTITAKGDGLVGAEGDLGLNATKNGVEADANAFIGARLGTDLSANYGPVDAGIGLSGEAGFGAGGKWHSSFEDGKLSLGGSLQLADGLGFKVDPHITIDTKPIVGAVENAGKGAVDWVEGLFN